MDNHSPSHSTRDSSPPTRANSETAETPETIPQDGPATLHSAPTSPIDPSPPPRRSSNSASWIINTLFPHTVRAGWHRIFTRIRNVVGSIPRTNLGIVLFITALGLGAAYGDPGNVPSWQQCCISFFIMMSFFGLAAVFLMRMEIEAMTRRERDQIRESLRECWGSLELRIIGIGDEERREAVGSDAMNEELTRMNVEIEGMLAARGGGQLEAMEEANDEDTTEDVHDENITPRRNVYCYDITFRHFHTGLTPPYQGQDEPTDAAHEDITDEQDGNANVLDDDDEYSYELSTLDPHTAPNAAEDNQNEPIEDADKENTREEELSLNSPNHDQGSDAGEDLAHGEDPVRDSTLSDSPNDPIIFHENQDTPTEDTYDEYTHVNGPKATKPDYEDVPFQILTAEDLNTHTSIPYDVDAETDTMLDEDDGDRDSVHGSRQQGGNKVGNEDERDVALQECLQGTTSDPPAGDVVHRSGLLGDSP